MLSWGVKLLSRLDDLYDYISKFGTIENLNIIKDKSTGNNKGYAFAEMSSPEEAWMLKQKGTGGGGGSPEEAWMLKQKGTLQPTVLI